MEREIKFRAWDGEFMIEWENLQEINLQELSMGVIIDSPTDGEQLEIKVMQFTGLKDKEGKEIYEGDILEFGISEITGHNKRKNPGLVAWENDGAYYRIKHLDSDVGVSFSAYLNEIWTEIIGNIYENPELIEL